MTPKSHARSIPGSDPARNAMEELEADRTAALTRMHPEEVGIESVGDGRHPAVKDAPYDQSIDPRTGGPTSSIDAGRPNKGHEERQLRDIQSTEWEEDFAANDMDEWGIDVLLDDWLADGEAPAGMATPVEDGKRAETETEDTQTDTSDDGSERW